MWFRWLVFINPSLFSPSLSSRSRVQEPVSAAAPDDRAPPLVTNQRARRLETEARGASYWSRAVSINVSLGARLSPRAGHLLREGCWALQVRGQATLERVVELENKGLYRTEEIISSSQFCVHVSVSSLNSLFDTASYPLYPVVLCWLILYIGRRQRIHPGHGISPGQGIAPSQTPIIHSHIHILGHFGVYNWP